jgi:pyruvate,orthophosphate dikinase
MNFYLKSVIDPVDNISDKIIGVAMPASNGAVSGKAVFNVQQAIEYAKNGIPSILIKQFTTSDDMTGLLSCSGVLTMMGGITSHAAETMRFLGKCAVTGMTALNG